NGKLIELSNASGGFAEIARSSSNGIATSWQNMKTAIVKGVTDVIAGIDEALGGVGSIASILDKGKEGVKTFFTFITENIPVAVKWLAKVRNTLEPWLPLLKAIVAGFVAFATINTIVAGVSNAIAVFVGIQKALRGVKLATDAAKASQVAYNAVLAINPWVLLAAA